MKKKIVSRIAVSFLFALLVLTGALASLSCASGKAASAAAGPLAANTIRVHYVRSDANYENMTLWVWEDTSWTALKGWPNGLAPAGETVEGVYFDIPLKANAQKLGFLAVNKTTGDAGKDGGDKSFAMIAQYKELWIRQGDDNVYISANWDKPVGILSASISGAKAIEAVFITTEGITEEQLLAGVSVTTADGTAVALSALSLAADGKTVVLDIPVDVAKAPYKVSFDGRTVDAVAGWRYVDGMFAYSGELGPKLNADGSATLKMWSPLVADVKVILYDKTNHDTVVRDNIPMVRGANGVWSVTLNQASSGVANLRGYFYNYKVDAKGDGAAKLALDPYAPSMAAYDNTKYPIGRGAIINVASIGPRLDYARIPGYAKREDAVIWEAHLRDLTVDPSIESQLKAPFGTYEALIDKLDYIQSLGVTHVQLLPVMSYRWGNELATRTREMEYSAKDQNYNWGYDPHSYFSLSGMYSVEPRNPEKRVEEFKKLVAAIHARGMGVILDVVYNHTADVRILEDLAPGYYHFMDKSGKPRTSFGGGRPGTTHAMTRRLLVDSIAFWTREYKVDGFRFDMMGDHDSDSIQQAWDAAKALNPNVLMIGEGWRTFAGDEGDRRRASDQDWMAFTDSVGVFSDEIRNELKSGFGSEGQARFITGGARNVQQIFENIKGQPRNFKADAPGDVVQYIEAHDNLTLHDVIAQSIKKDPEVPASNLEIHRRIRIGNTLVLTSQGIAFLHAGQEYGRTKQWRTDGEPEQKGTRMVDTAGKPFVYPWFVHDSYDSSDSINMFDWTKATNAALFPVNDVTRRYTAGLIALRRSTDAFRLGSKALVDTNVTRIAAPEIKTSDLVVAYRALASNGSAYYVFVNADTQARTLTLDSDLTGGTVLADDDEAGVSAVTAKSGFTLSAASLQLNPLTVVIIKK